MAAASFLAFSEEVALHARDVASNVSTGLYRGKAAVFLASDDASFVAGVELFVDGVGAVYRRRCK